MLRRIRITPSTMIAVIALVFAATGGAFAATNSSGSSAPRATANAAKAKPKAKTGPRGPAGPAGKQGAQGPAGPAGATGPQGAAGAKGETGTAGTAGAGGKEGEEGEEGKTGKEGPKGAQGDPGTPGTPGTPGATGQPWTPNNQLPSGATETGTWGASPGAGAEGVATINFPIALANELESETDNEHVHLVPYEPDAAGTGNLTDSGETEVVTGVTASSGEFKVGAGIEDTTNPAAIPPGTVITEVISPTEFKMSKSATVNATGDSLKAGNPHGCPAGATEQKPAAEAGNLCAYVGENSNDTTIKGPYKPNNGLGNGAGTTGAVLVIEGASPPNFVWGTWAVKAE